jgi:hypothetical protein
VQYTGGERSALAGVDALGSAGSLQFDPDHRYDSFREERLSAPLRPSKSKKRRLRSRTVELGWMNENPAFRQLFTSLFIR